MQGAEHGLAKAEPEDVTWKRRVRYVPFSSGPPYFPADCGGMASPRLLHQRPQVVDPILLLHADRVIDVRQIVGGVGEHPRRVIYGILPSLKVPALGAGSILAAS